MFAGIEQYNNCRPYECEQLPHGPLLKQETGKGKYYSPPSLNLVNPVLKEGIRKGKIKTVEEISFVGEKSHTLVNYDSGPDIVASNVAEVECSGFQEGPNFEIKECTSSNTVGTSDIGSISKKEKTSDTEIRSPSQKERVEELPMANKEVIIDVNDDVICHEVCQGH